jgi:hypothetical protein
MTGWISPLFVHRKSSEMKTNVSNTEQKLAKNNDGAADAVRTRAGLPSRVFKSRGLKSTALDHSATAADLCTYDSYLDLISHAQEQSGSTRANYIPQRCSPMRGHGLGIGNIESLVNALRRVSRQVATRFKASTYVALRHTQCHKSRCNANSCIAVLQGAASASCTALSAGDGPFAPGAWLSMTEKWCSSRTNSP